MHNKKPVNSKTEQQKDKRIPKRNVKLEKGTYGKTSTGLRLHPRSSRKKTGRRGKMIIEKIIAENFLSVGKEHRHPYQGSPECSSNINSEIPPQRHIINNISKTQKQQKDKILLHITEAQ